jgi:hypothetical protein
VTVADGTEQKRARRIMSRPEHRVSRPAHETLEELHNGRMNSLTSPNYTFKVLLSKLKR